MFGGKSLKKNFKVNFERPVKIFELKVKLCYLCCFLSDFTLHVLGTNCRSMQIYQLLSGA